MDGPLFFMRQSRGQISNFWLEAEAYAGVLTVFGCSWGPFKYYITQRRWVGGLQNVTIPMQLEKFSYGKVLLEVGGWSK